MMHIGVQNAFQYTNLQVCSYTASSMKIIAVLGIIFGGMYVNVGVQHFTNTAWFEPIVPAILGDPTIWVLITGVMEIAIGVGLILPFTRRYAGLASLVFLVGIYWANFNMWVNNIPLDGKTYAHHWHVLRLMAQLGMMVLSYAIWRSSSSEVSSEADSNASTLVVQ